MITTDGTTLLGADDKAGIAEVLTVIEEILTDGTPHGKICIGFTPDEEIAKGSEAFRCRRDSVRIMDIHWTEVQKVRSSTRTSMHLQHLLQFMVSACIPELQKMYW